MVAPAFLSDLVRTILVMTLSGSLLTLLLVLLKPLVRLRIPRARQYALWFVVLAALLVPFSKFIVLPDTATNITLTPIHAVVERNVLSVAEESSRATVAGSAVTTNTSDSIGSGSAGSGSAGSGSDTPVTAPTTGKPGLSARIFTAFMIVYPLGVGVLLLYNLVGYAYFRGKVRFRKIVSISNPDALIKLCDGKRPPRLYICPLAPTPMLVGLFRPCIMLPDRDYTDAQLKSVLQHELTHLRRRDVVVKWVTVLACSLHWFNPVVWLARREISRACELACDAAVIRHMNVREKETYGNTLIAMAAKVRVSRAVLATTLCEERKALKERLFSIMKHKPPKRFNQTVSVLILTVLAGAACILGAAESTAAEETVSVGEITPAATPSSAKDNTPNGEFTVIYNYAENGGVSATSTTATVASGEQADLTPTAKKEGWDFVGWNTDRDARIGLTSCPIQTADVTLYAIYKKELTAIFVDYSGGTKQLVSHQALIFNNATEAIIDFPNQHIYTDYFIWEPRGWSKSTAPDAEPVLFGSDRMSSDTTYYGLYQLSGTITYNAGCPATIPPETVIHYTNSYNIGNKDFRSIHLPNPPSNPGFTFVKWQSSLSGKLFDPGDACEPGEPVTMNAVWKTNL
ncbi:MAG: InlB B-repeat-containing protein [Gracilibacteraceae bacterium]|jgi:uncharacterized repeat protein (TIGR02543 family)|nr:InlB B-repeat-containing protein [Gracilibacteraceae bacterium]